MKNYKVVIVSFVEFCVHLWYDKFVLKPFSQQKKGGTPWEKI